MNQRVEKQAYKILEFCFAFGVGRTKLYQEIGRGRIKTFKVGTITLISKKEAMRWVEMCESEATQAVKA